MDTRERPSPEAIEGCIAQVLQAEREAQSSIESAEGRAAAAIAQVRRKHWRARLRWLEVGTNEYGAGTVCDRYVIQLQHGTDGANAVGDTRRFVVNSKDEDADTEVVKIVEAIAKRYYYRFRVLAINKAGCRSSWSSWTSWQQPGNEGPPAPTNVKVYDTATDRLVIEWTAPAAPNDADVIDQDIYYFQVQVSISSTFATNYKFDRMHAGMRKSFKVNDTESGGSIYYLRARSVNSEGDKSYGYRPPRRATATPPPPPTGSAPELAAAARSSRRGRSLVAPASSTTPTVAGPTPRANASTSSACPHL